MRDAVIILLLLAVGILGYFARSMNTTIADQQRQIGDISSKARASSLDLQEKCAKQAALFFKDQWAQEKMAVYENHYNQQLDKCFVMVHNTSNVSGTFVMSSELDDAFGRTSLGAYVHFADHTGSDVGKPKCFFTPPSGGTMTCNAEKEFKELVKAYMQ